MALTSRNIATLLAASITSKKRCIVGCLPALDVKINGKITQLQTQSSIAREETSYGLRQAGTAPFVIVAPHATGDDWKTNRLALRLAKKMKAFLVINKKYFKPNNQKTEQRPAEFAADFNQLSWSPTYGKYLWKRKPPAMKNFYKDIKNYCKAAKASSGKKEIVVVYLHGMRDRHYGIDLGVGLKAKNPGNRFLNRQDRPYSNSGNITIRISQLKQLKALLAQRLQTDHKLAVGVGRKYIGWSKRSAIQFHKQGGRNDLALQVELCRRLRRLHNVDYSVKILSDALVAVFGA